MRRSPKIETNGPSIINAGTGWRSEDSDIIESSMTKEPKAQVLSSLDAVAGPLKGSSFPLAAELTSIGREPSNTISILDGSISRHHCVIKKDGQRFTLEDLDSRNGTFVNHTLVKQRVLEAGDEIRVGNSLFLFVPGQSGTSTDSAASIEIRNEPLAAGSTIVLRREQVRYLTSSVGGPAPLPASSRV